MKEKGSVLFGDSTGYNIAYSGFNPGYKPDEIVETGTEESSDKVNNKTLETSPGFVGKYKIAVWLRGALVILLALALTKILSGMMLYPKSQDIQDGSDHWDYNRYLVLVKELLKENLHPIAAEQEKISNRINLERKEYEKSLFSHVRRIEKLVEMSNCHSNQSLCNMRENIENLRKDNLDFKNYVLRVHKNDYEDIHGYISTFIKGIAKNDHIRRVIKEEVGERKINDNENVGQEISSLKQDIKTIEAQNTDLKTRLETLEKTQQEHIDGLESRFMDKMECLSKRNDELERLVHNMKNLSGIINRTSLVETINKVSSEDQGKLLKKIDLFSEYFYHNSSNRTVDKLSGSSDKKTGNVSMDDEDVDFAHHLSGSMPLYRLSSPPYFGHIFHRYYFESIYEFVSVWVRKFNLFKVLDKEYAKATNSELGTRECLRIVGQNGNFTLLISNTIVPAKVSIYSSPFDIKNEMFWSSPLNLEIFGVSLNKTNNRAIFTSLCQSQIDKRGKIKQDFSLENRGDGFRIFQLRFYNNCGNPMYTQICRFSIFGKQVDKEEFGEGEEKSAHERLLSQLKTMRMHAQVLIQLVKGNAKRRWSKILGFGRRFFRRIPL